MSKRHEFTNGDGFDGIRHSANIREFDQHDIPIQLFNDGTNLAFGEMHFWQVFHGRHDIKHFHRILQSQNR